METGCLLRWCLMKGSNMISVCFHSPSTASPGNGWCFNYVHLITISRYFVFSSLKCPSFEDLVPRIQHLPLVIYKIPGASPLFLEDFYPWHTAIFSNSMLGLILDCHMNAGQSFEDWLLSSCTPSPPTPAPNQLFVPTLPFIFSPWYQMIFQSCTWSNLWSEPHFPKHLDFNNSLAPLDLRVPWSCHFALLFLHVLMSHLAILRFHGHYMSLPCPCCKSNVKTLDSNLGQIHIYSHVVKYGWRTNKTRNTQAGLTLNWWPNPCWPLKMASLLYFHQFLVFLLGDGHFRVPSSLTCQDAPPYPYPHVMILFPVY